MDKPARSVFWLTGTKRAASGSVGQIKNADLDQFADGEIPEAAGFHALDEVWCDFEDTHLNQLVGIGLIAESAILFDLVGVDALHRERGEFPGGKIGITESGHTVHEGRVDFKD